MPGNNDALQDTTVVSSADLSIAKTDGVAVVTAGTSTVYTITLTNNGPSVEPAGVVISDPIPAGTNANEIEPDCAIVASVFVCTTSTALGVGTSVAYMLTLAIPPAYASATVTNTASITSSPIADPTLGNDSVTDVDAVTSAADLALTKTDGVASVAAGASTTYTITVTNDGPSTEPAGVVVSDTVPAGTTGTETELDCAIAAGVFTCTTSAPLVSGASVAYQLQVAVPPGYAPASLSNTASITAAPIADPNAANDAATDVDAVTTSADLGITKTDGVTSVTPGSSTTFTITVTNAGPSSVPAGVVVSDPIPAGTTGTESEADCSIAAATFTCTTSAVLASGASVVYQLVVAIPATYVGATLVNTATISFSPVPDPNPANGSATDTDTVTPIVDDLSIVKTDSADPVAPGDSFSYTIVVSNAGPDAAPNVVVTDPVPPAFTVTGVSSSQGSCTNAANLVSCTLASLAAGSTWTITVEVDVPADATSGSVINTASVTGIGDTTSANDSATQSTTVGTPVVASADLVLTIVVDDGTPNEGDVVTYTITVANKGPDDATGVVVTDMLPNGVTFVSSRSARGSYKPGTGAWDIGALAARRTIRLAPGQSVTLQIDAMVDAGTAGTTVHNPAAVSQLDQVDPTPQDDADTAPISVTKVSGAGGSTAFTGFPGDRVFVWMFLFTMLGLVALGLERVARRLSPIPTGDVDEDTPRASSRQGRFLSEPFFFFRKE